MVFVTKSSRDCPSSDAGSGSRCNGRDRGCNNSWGKSIRIYGGSVNKYGCSVNINDCIISSNGSSIAVIQEQLKEPAAGRSADS